VSLAWCASAYAAEDPVGPASLSAGRRVRVTSSPDVEPVIGSVVSVEADAVVIRHAGSNVVSRIPMAEIRKLDVSLGRRSRAGRGAMIGAAVGVMPGLLMTTGDYSSDVHGESNAATVAVAGAAGGALLGAGIGWALKSESWRPSEVPSAAVSAAPVRGGVAVSLRLTWR
jgi:hypothetical protein